MSTNKLFNELNSMYNQLGRGMLNALRAKKHEALVEKILRCTAFLDICNPSIGQRIQWILSQKQDHLDKCKTCGQDISKLKMLGDTTSFEYCSSKCAASNDETKAKREKTCIKKYGSKFAASSDQIKDKTKQTNLKRYGVENVYQSSEIKNKIAATKLNKYGDAGYTNVEKKKSTCLDKYGVECVFASDEIKKKIEKTCKEKYGAKHHMQNKAISDAIATKSRATTLKKTYKFICENEYSEPCFDEATFISSFTNDFLFDFKCKKCGKTFKTACYDHRLHRCPDCYPLNYHSYMEDDIMQFLKDNYDGKILHGKGTRKIIHPYELDIYVPDKRLAIEFDGLYWHSEEQGKDAKYHVTKTNLCEQQGIHLIHIFEDEWISNKEIVQSRLLNAIGKYENTVFARKCEVKEVSANDCSEFLTRCHIQGKVGANVRLGLYHRDELISLMTFGKCRFDKKHEWELLRFCNKLGYHVPGAAGKLLKHFERNYNPKSLVSYADRRWSQGKVYEALDFKLDHISAPNYWYFKTTSLRESRMKYQKHKLKAVLKEYDEKLSESENMKKNGYHKIYDCGNLVYAKNYI